jgi:hypothetical protein
MKSLSFILAVGAGFLLAGCLVPSLHPLFTGKDIVVRSDLVGAWTAEEGGAGWLFSLEPDSSYSVAYSDYGDNDTSWFTAHLVDLNGHLFMDLYPNPTDVLSDAYKSHLIAAHTFSKVELDSSGLTLAILDVDWLRENLDSGRIHLAHEELGPGDFVLTASTAELQKFILSVVDDTDAFSSIDLYRINQVTDSI